MPREKRSSTRMAIRTALVCSSEDVVGIAGALLKQHVEAIEHLEREKADIAEAIKERYASLKADGFAPMVDKDYDPIRRAARKLGINLGELEK